MPFETPQTTIRARAPRADMIAIKSVGNADISYETVVLAQRAAPYESGEILVRPYTQSEPGDPGAAPPVEASGYDTPAAQFVGLGDEAAEDWPDYDTLEVAVNLYRTNASAGAKAVTAVVRLAEVKTRDTSVPELELDPGDAATLLAAFAKSFVLFR